MINDIRISGAMKCCAHTGMVTEKNLITVFRLNHRIIAMLAEHNYLEKHSEPIAGSIVKIYRLGPSGVKWIKNNTNISHLYRWNPKHSEHDAALSDYYCKLPTRLQDTWKNESQILLELSLKNSLNALGIISALDATIQYEDNSRIAIEVVTSNYSPQKIQQKKDVAKLLNCKIFMEIKIKIQNKKVKKNGKKHKENFL